jgi:hypothetical protein
MMIRRTSLVACLVLSFTWLNATALRASGRVSIDVERGPDDAYVVVAAFEASAGVEGGTRVTYRLTADPSGR